jgi:hypothetical protein
MAKVQGRPVKHTKEFLEALLKEKAGSTLSLRALCKHRNLSHSAIVKALAKNKLSY